jgi:hypothetical protein
MNLKPAIMGTNDYRAVLLAACAEGWQAQAGYVAKNAPESECSLPQMIYLYCMTGRVVGYETDDDVVYIGEITYAVLFGKLCFDCRHNLNHVHDTLFFISWGDIGTRDIDTHFTHCEVCGIQVKDNDDIPF